MTPEKKRYKKGHFIGLGVALGIPLGIPIGMAMGNIALGPAMGLPIGIAIGAAMESKYNSNPLELTEKEKRRQRKWIMILLVFGCILLLTLLGYFFISNS